MCSRPFQPHKLPCSKVHKLTRTDSTTPPLHGTHESSKPQNGAQAHLSVVPPFHKPRECEGNTRKRSPVSCFVVKGTTSNPNHGKNQVGYQWAHLARIHWAGGLQTQTKQERDTTLQVSTSAVPALTDETNRLCYQVLWPRGVVTHRRTCAQSAMNRNQHPGALWQWIVTKATAIVPAKEQSRTKPEAQSKGTKGYSRVLKGEHLHKTNKEDKREATHQGRHLGHNTLPH